MTNKTMGIIGMVLGALCVLSNLAVGFWGWPWLYRLAAFPSIGFGWRKIVFIVLGAAVFVVGWILYDKAKKLEEIRK